MASISTQQKKVQILQKQLYGGNQKTKSSDIKVQSHQTDGNVFSLEQITTSTNKSSQDKETSDIYLKKDMFKILTLSTLILGIQFLIFYAMQVNILPAWI